MVKRLLVLGVIVLMLGLGSGAEAKDLQLPPPPDTLRVLSIGLHCPTQWDCPWQDLWAIADEIAYFRPDILLVRELFWANRGEILLDHINSNPTGYRLNYHEILPGRPRCPWPIPDSWCDARGGTMIATTNFPIEMATSHTFQNRVLPDSLVPKGVIHVRVKLGTRSNGEDVYMRVANTHLQAGTADWVSYVRQNQIAELEGYMNNEAYQMPLGKPLLFGGDFNAAQTGWATDLGAWNKLYATMKSWYLDSVQKMCGDAGETACQGSSQAASDFQSEVQQLFLTQPHTYDSELGGYKLTPIQYQSIPDPFHLTDHPFIIVDFRYEELSPRKQMYRIFPWASEPYGRCPDNYPVLREIHSEVICGYPLPPTRCPYVRDWYSYTWECSCPPVFFPGPFTCSRMGWFKTTVRTDFNAGDIMVNGQRYPSGYTFDPDGIITATLNAVSSQTVGGQVYNFEHWEKRDAAGNVVETHSSPSWTITIDGDYTYVAVSQFDAHISGPDTLGFQDEGDFTAEVMGGIGTIAYEWRWRQRPPYQTPGQWGNVISTSQTYRHYMAQVDFELLVKVTGNGREIYRTKYVTYYQRTVGGGRRNGGNLDIAIGGPETLAEGQTGNFSADVPPNCCNSIAWQWRYVGDSSWSDVLGRAPTYSHRMGSRDIELQLTVSSPAGSGWATLTVARSGGQGPVQPKVPSNLVSKEAQGAK